ncbi:MAG: hypothetical protein ABI551_25405 [Polyangiaceae bacterium]
MRVWTLFGSAGVALGIALGAFACSSTPTTLGTVLATGITVRAASLTTDLGCGTGNGQVYKYAAVLADPAAAGLYDCFADAAFVKLPLTGDGGGIYDVTVFMYDKATYDANAGAIQSAIAGADPATALSAIPASFTTSCTATQTLNIQTVAQCAPRSAGGPGVLRIETDAFTTADGGTLGCHVGFDIVSVDEIDGGADAGTINQTCPNEVLLGPFPALTQQAARVTLVQGLTAIGTTTCRGTIAPSSGTTATCDPVAAP